MDLNENRNLAPIALFVYNRPDHTIKTVEALKKNNLAIDSDLIIFSDGPKFKLDIEKVNKVREFIRTISGFKSVKINESNINRGLGTSIIEGVSSIINEFGKIIVMEDDLISHPLYLKFMNSALDYYSNKKGVWHISGWNYPICTENLNDTFLWRTMNCWGWATWSDRWKHFSKDPEKVLLQFNKDEIEMFNIDNSYNFWKQIIANKKGRKNSWAIFWYATIFKRNGLCLNPSSSLIKNIGLDGSGTNSGSSKSYISNFKNSNFKQLEEFRFEQNIIENKKARESIKQYYLLIKPSTFLKIKNKLKIILVKASNKLLK